MPHHLEDAASDLWEKRQSLAKKNAELEMEIFRLNECVSRFKEALFDIVRDAPEIEPRHDLRSANDYEISDAGYDQARWQMAEIAKKALNG